MLNSFGQVVGVTTATAGDRTHVAFVVPIARANLSGVEGGQFLALPLELPGPPPVFVYAPFPSVLTFDSVSPNAEFHTGGSIFDFVPSDEDSTLARNFDYIYFYGLPSQYYDDLMIYFHVLEEQGFILQGINTDTDGIIMDFSYHPEKDVTLLVTYRFRDEVAMVAFGRGNVYARLSGSEASVETNNSIIGTWECYDATVPHEWFCLLIFSEDGRFVDLDGDEGSFIITEDTLDLFFDYFEDPSSRMRFTYSIQGNQLTLSVLDTSITLIRR
ncbi:MAG: hypothetical protein FWD99_01735 [Oscillospiraceae bacterium]|nr:hypothetical protein [Oscillospiraceae bacterium]